MFIALAANGVAATFLADGYAIRVWQTGDGLPQNLVTSATQTSDGYLWFGTQSGLARFDGERFKVFNSANEPELRDRRITSLFEDAEETLWIGLESGAVTRLRSGNFEEVLPSGDENSKIIGLGSDEKGRLWAMRQSGIVESLDGNARFPSLITEDHPGVMSWSRSVNGNIWLMENFMAVRIAEDRLDRVLMPPPYPESYLSGIAAASDGGAWIVCDGRIRKWKDGQWTEDRGEIPWGATTLTSCLELRDGTLAIGTIRYGLYLVFSDGRHPIHLGRDDGLPQSWIRFLYEDREGTIWAGTGSSGLVSIHETAFSVLDAAERWQDCSVLSVAADQDNGLWIGTDGAGLHHYSSAGEWNSYGPEEGLANQYIPSVAVNARGEVWAGDYWWGGPYRLKNGQFVRPEGVDPAWSPALALLGISDSSAMLVGNRDGLLELDGDRSKWLIRSPEGTADDVTAVAVDRDGAIWCGFARGGLARIAEGKFSLFGQEDGLGSDTVQCLFSDDDGALWIGTADRGLARLKEGRFTVLGTEQGLLDNTVCHVVDDGLGNFWLSTHHGLQRVSKEALNRCADGEISSVPSQTYDGGDGLPVIEFLCGRQSAACKTVDGRLWFATSKGVVCVDPSQIVTNTLPPPVVVDALLVDGQEVAIESGAALVRLPPDHERLEFRYAGLSYVAPSKVHFKYRLEGLDKNWIDVGSKREAFYSQLPAGKYLLRVIACNDDGVWNMEGASLAFSVAPFFWETWWFVGACVLAALGVVALLARYVTRRRMQRKMKDMEHRHAVERERSRIAQDIHDDVGASLSRIAILSQTARSQFAESDRAVAVLSNIYGTARSVTRALDEIVWAVNPKHDTLDSLVDYMGKFAHDFLSAANVRCRLDLPVEVPPWPLSAEVRHNLFLAFKEALNNAVKHAFASEARVSVEVRPGGFVISLKDNGRGLRETDAEVGASSARGVGNGLINMRARLARIGGRCEISSDQGSGTKVTFVLDVANSGSGSRG